MGLFNKLFHKKEAEKTDVTLQSAIPTERLMTSQFPALYLKENNRVYRDIYIKKLVSLGFNKKYAEKMFDFECGIISRHEKQYLYHPQFTEQWFFGLEHPFFLQYPRTKEEILKEKYLTMSELCKIIDEAEWHFWNSHNRELPDDVWEEIYAWHLKGAGGEFAISYFEMIEKETGIPAQHIAQLSSEQGKHLSQYKWR